MDDATTRTMVLTAPGTGAIGAIRLQGANALKVIVQVFRSCAGSEMRRFDPGRIYYGHFADEHERIDDVLVCYDCPHHVPTVDITAHGGIRVMERIVATLSRLGAALVPAEQTLASDAADNAMQESAISLMTTVPTVRGLRFLARQRHLLVKAVDDLIAAFDANDPNAFPALAELHSGYASASRLLHGVTVGIVGAPNAGKSTLFNKLVGNAAAIVSAEPGTTRDWLQERIDVCGLPVTLIDTAGMRADTDPLEAAAMHAGSNQSRKADLLLSVLDQSESPGATPCCAPVRSGSQVVLMVLSKSDLPCAWAPDQRKALNRSGLRCLQVSAHTGEGMDDLCQAIADAMLGEAWSDYKPTILTLRHSEVVSSLLKKRPRPDEAADVLRDIRDNL